MKQLHASTLADALLQWGRHEAEGRLKGQLTALPTTQVDCLNVLLHTRPNMVAHLLKREPLQTLLVELEPGDEASWRLSNGQSVDDWMAHIQTQTDPASWAHVQALVQAEHAPVGPVLLVACMLEGQDSTQQTLISSLVLYDGWHRTAAWLLRCRDQRPSKLQAHLVIARHRGAHA